ncbi:MAG TPA: kelch repeat-containing protein [Burkholderiaceae bacterium]|nr:kelch repeat-containing protein [Burkholderiaceae bacterium]
MAATGGSSVRNALTDVSYNAEIWNRATGTWTVGADEAVPRMYHSSAILLPDASVLVGGGGAPGPLTNLNVETYYTPQIGSTPPR